VAASLAGGASCPQGNAQTAALPSAPVAAEHLTITILEGEGALNNIRQRDAREPIVQVTDENHKPVSGVALVFLIHDGSSATATFNGGLTLSTTTNAEGIARATGLQVGPKAGSFTIGVTATVGATVVASAVIHQSNALGAPSSTTENPSSSTASGSTAQTSAASAVAKHGILHLSKTALIAGGTVVAAAAVAGIVYATRGNSATTLTLGSTTVGHP
jgi:hypothetical protein